MTEWKGQGQRVFAAVFTKANALRPHVAIGLRRAWSLAMAHKYATAVTCLAILLFLWPKGLPPQRGIANDRADTAASHASVGQPTTQPVSGQYAGDVPLYMPDQAGADASWSLPAELKADESKKAVADVDKLARDLGETLQLQKAYDSGIGSLLNQQVLSLFWSRLTGKGFQDANLPLDWYDIVKDRNSIFGDMSAVADMFANQMIQAALISRLTSVQVRLVGGKVLVGDMLFVKATRQYVDLRLPRFRKLVPLMQGVSNRIGQEFKVELDQQRRRSANPSE